MNIGIRATVLGVGQGGGQTGGQPVREESSPNRREHLIHGSAISTREGGYFSPTKPEDGFLEGDAGVETILGVNRLWAIVIC